MPITTPVLWYESLNAFTSARFELSNSKRELEIQLTAVPEGKLTEFVDDHILGLMGQAIESKMGNVVYYGVLCHVNSGGNRETRVGLICAKHRLIPKFSNRLLSAKECEDLDIPTSWGIIDAPEEKPIPTRFQRAWVI